MSISGDEECRFPPQLRNGLVLLVEENLKSEEVKVKEVVLVPIDLLDLSQDEFVGLLELCLAVGKMPMHLLHGWDGWFQCQHPVQFEYSLQEGVHPLQVGLVLGEVNEDAANDSQQILLLDI